MESVFIMLRLGSMRSIQNKKSFWFYIDLFRKYCPPTVDALMLMIDVQLHYIEETSS